MNNNDYESKKQKYYQRKVIDIYNQLEGKVFEELELIKQKKSKLSASERNLVKIACATIKLKNQKKEEEKQCQDVNESQDE